MTAWSELPEELWWTLYKSKDAGVLDYMDEHHRCVHGNHGTRVESCDTIAVPGSWYCYRHGEGDFCE